MVSALPSLSSRHSYRCRNGGGALLQSKCGRGNGARRHGFREDSCWLHICRHSRRSASRALCLSTVGAVVAVAEITTLAVASFEVSATDFAVTVTVCCEVDVDGAV